MIYLLVAVYLTAHFMDWAQTRVIAQHPERWREMNPILGEHPLPTAVNIYFATLLVILGLFLYFAPAWIALSVMSIIVPVEIFVVVRNFQHGIRL